MNEGLFTDRVPTGIPGLDGILEGGLIKGGVYLVQGPPGAGKTIFANQFCFHHAGGGGHAVYVTLLAESHSRMIGHLRRMKFFRPELVPDHIYYLSAFKVLEADGLTGLAKSIRETVVARNASLLVLDGLVTAEESADSDRDFKKFIHELQTIASFAASTILLLSSGTPKRVHPEHTMVDGILELTDELTKLRSMRHLFVRKLRGTNQTRGQHTLLISDEGIVIHPRIESQTLREDQDEVTPGAERMHFGVPELDAMLCGGVPSNSVTMMLGPSGCGKTILGLQFLAAGAARGERGLYFGFYERPEALLAKGRRINLGLVEAYEAGLVSLLWRAPIEGIIDVLANELLTLVREKKVKRLCIDGMQGFQQTIDFPERIRSLFSAIAEDLEALGVTTVYTSETPDLFGPLIEVPVSGLSPLTHNIILLRHVELDAHLFRLISILKVRDSSYDSAIREFRIEDDGIQVADTFESADSILTGTARPPMNAGRTTKKKKKKKKGQKPKKQR